MHRTFHSANDNNGREPAKPRFRFRESLKERRYSGISKKIGRIESELEACRGKKLLLAHLERESKASIVEEDQSNWTEAMKAMERAKSHRKSLARDVRGTAAAMFGGALLCAEMAVATIGAALHLAAPETVTGPIVAIVAAIVAAGAAMYTYAMVTLGEDAFLGALRSRIEERQDGLMAEKQKLMRKLHGI